MKSLAPFNWNTANVWRGSKAHSDGRQMLSFSHGVLFWEYVAGHQWTRLLIPYPDCSLELVAPSSNINLPWREAEHMLDLKTLKRWGWNRQRGTGVWTCKQLLAVNLEINEEERLWRAGTSSNNPRPGLWVTSSLQEHGTECMELWFLLYLLY